MKLGIRHLRLFAVVLLICVLCACTANTPVGDDCAVVPEEIAINYKVCRTGGGRIEGWTSQHGKPGEAAPQAVTAVPKLGYIFTGWSDGVTEATRSDVFGMEDLTVTANFSFDRKNMPIISITTETGKDVTSKDTYIGATVSICNT